jgi:hypothetical protein
MPPKKPAPRSDELFRSQLDNMIDMGHALEAWRHDYNHFRPHSSLGNRTPAEMGTGSIDKPSWGHAPNTVVAITPSDGHHNGPRLYS